VEKFRIGLVGCGRLAERGYVPAVRRARGVELVAVADVDPTRRTSVADGLSAFRSISELLANAKVDGVVIATPPSSHLEDARMAADAGTPTLVEKPPAADLADARQLAALAPPPWIAFNRRFAVGLAEARHAIASDAVTLALELRYWSASWRPYTSAPDALLDAGVHLIDLARWLSASDISRVRATFPTAMRGFLELDLDGMRASLEYALDQPHRERVEAVDADGKLVHRYVDGGVWHALVRRVRSPGEDNPFVNSLARQLEDFARAARDGPPDRLATAADGLEVMKAVAAARRSVEHGSSWQNVPS
jgi:predicted dehydrogenase